MKQNMINSWGMVGKTTRPANQGWKYREKKWKQKLTKNTKFCFFFLIKYMLHVANLQTGWFFWFFFCFHFWGPSNGQRSLSHLVWPTPLNRSFFSLLQPHSSSHNWGICMRIFGSTSTLPVIYRKCSHGKQAVHTKSVRLWISIRSWVE